MPSLLVPVLFAAPVAHAHRTASIRLEQRIGRSGGGSYGGATPPGNAAVACRQYLTPGAAAVVLVQRRPGALVERSTPAIRRSRRGWAAWASFPARPASAASPPTCPG